MINYEKTILIQEQQQSKEVFSSFNLVVLGLVVFFVVLIGLKTIYRFKAKHKFNKFPVDQLQNKIIQAKHTELLQIYNFFLNYQKESVIIYALYKQFLYLKTKMYHGTNLTSIFTIIKNQSKHQKQKQRESQKKSMSSFENEGLQCLKFQIQHQCINLKDNMTKMLQLLSCSSLKIKNAQDPTKSPKISQPFQIDRHKQKQILQNVCLADFFKYNIWFKQRISALQQKIEYMSKQICNLAPTQLVKRINTQTEDQQWFQLLKLSILLCSDFTQFVQLVQTKILLADPIIQAQRLLQRKGYSIDEKQKRIGKLLAKILPFEQDQHFLQIKNTKFLNIVDQIGELFPNTAFSQSQMIKNEKLKMHQFYNLNKFQKMTQLQKKIKIEENLQKNKLIQLSSLQSQIKILQSFAENVNNRKVQIYQNLQCLNKISSAKQLQNDDSYKKIHVFDSNNIRAVSQIGTCSLYKGQDSVVCQISRGQNKQKPQVIENFSTEKRLSFIKNLDKIMMRNRMRRQQQQAQKKMKQIQEQSLNNNANTECQGNIIQNYTLTSQNH